MMRPQTRNPGSRADRAGASNSTHALSLHHAEFIAFYGAAQFEGGAIVFDAIVNEGKEGEVIAQQASAQRTGLFAQRFAHAAVIRFEKRIVLDLQFRSARANVAKHCISSFVHASFSIILVLL